MAILSKSCSHRFRTLLGYFKRENSGEHPIGRLRIVTLNRQSIVELFLSAWCDLEERRRGKQVNKEERLMNNDGMFSGPELVCADCGVRFRARRVTDGVEEICDVCYEARFPTRPALVPRRTHAPLHGHLAAD